MADGVLRLSEIAAASVPTPPSGKVRVFVDSADGHLKFKLDTGAVLDSSTTSTFTADAGGTTAGQVVTLAGGLGIQTTRSGDTVTFDASVLNEYVYAREEQAALTEGGTFTSGAFRTRVLNTLVVNDIGAGVSLASNEITLPAGTWRCFITLPFFAVVGSAGRLFNVTDAAVVPDMISSTGYSAGTNPVIIQGQFVLAASKDLRIEHECSTTISTNGLGRATSDPSGQNVVYTEAVFVRVAL